MNDDAVNLARTAVTLITITDTKSDIVYVTRAAARLIADERLDVVSMSTNVMDDCVSVSLFVYGTDALTAADEEGDTDDQ